MKPAGMDKSGIEGIASRHGYRVAKEPLALYDLRLDEARSATWRPSIPMWSSA